MIRFRHLGLVFEIPFIKQAWICSECGFTTTTPEGEEVVSEKALAHKCDSHAVVPHCISAQGDFSPESGRIHPGVQGDLGGETPRSEKPNRKNRRKQNWADRNRD